MVERVDDLKHAEEGNRQGDEDSREGRRSPTFVTDEPMDFGSRRNRRKEREDLIISLSAEPEAGHEARPI
jgi:hypothetical protein